MRFDTDATLTLEETVVKSPVTNEVPEKLINHGSKDNSQ
jgi:hypothetical protein